MKHNAIIIVSLLAVSSVSATGNSSAATDNPLLGTWGTDAQCSRALILATGTKRAAPFDIQSEWLQNGDVWCRMGWSMQTQTQTGVIAEAWALCGEDDVRRHHLGLKLDGQLLSLVWNFKIKNGPLKRCN